MSERRAVLEAVVEAGAGFPGDRRARGGVGGHVGAPHVMNATVAKVIGR